MAQFWLACKPLLEGGGGCEDQKVRFDHQKRVINAANTPL